MHYAAKARLGHDAFVERLLAAGAKVDAVDKDGRGLGAGRFDPDSTCGNFGLRTLNTYRKFERVSGKLSPNHAFELIETVVGKKRRTSICSKMVSWN